MNVFLNRECQKARDNFDHISVDHWEKNKNADFVEYAF